jgi:hypothetical protein
VCSDWERVWGVWVFTVIGTSAGKLEGQGETGVLLASWGACSGGTSASLDKGVLTVTLPKMEPKPRPAEPKRITVQGGASK